MAEEWRTDIKALTSNVYYWFAKDCPGLSIEQFGIYEFGNEYYPVLDTNAWTGVSTVRDRDSGSKYSAMIHITSRMREYCTEDGIRAWIIRDMTEGILREWSRWERRKW